MYHNVKHVEIEQRNDSTVDPQEVVKAVQKCRLSGQSPKITDPFLLENVASVRTTVDNPDKAGCDCCTQYHVFRLHDLDSVEEKLGEGDNDAAVATHWTLPCAEFQGLWESLKFDADIKGSLLKYIKVIMQYADRGVDPNIISCNRVVFLHGPPGTGKTTLCKALAQKVAIQMSHRFGQGSLLEINSHSLFSKWFSESANLVMKMFARIEELVQDPDMFVGILIDEVESLTAARAAHCSGTEPSDAVRVVNALLTQLDRIKKYPNVIILTTSNVTAKVDLAFVDRADIKQYIGPPSVAAIYEILRSCVAELMRSEIIQPVLKIPSMKNAFTKAHNNKWEAEARRHYEKLHEVSQKCSGMSGRSLRKMPLITHASFVENVPCTMDEFLAALVKAVEMKFQEEKHLNV